MDVLIIGGTRNLGHQLSLALLAAGHRVTVLNRGRTADELPAEVERLRADRGNRAQLAAALGQRSFDAVIDMVLYTGTDAALIVELLRERVGHYIFISTGQVYLVLAGAKPPFAESDYAGSVIPAPLQTSRDYGEWQYGGAEARRRGCLDGRLAGGAVSFYISASTDGEQ